METVSTATTLRECLQQWRAAGERIAFVPTMGNLHAGHLSLVEHARTLAPRVVVSIFVNPLQFGPREDYASYPKTPESDCAALRQAATDLLFMPGADELYPRGKEHTSVVSVPDLGGILEGEYRPGHFDGVATVVAKLFNLVQPEVAVFGEKDYQQLLLVRRMVEDLCLPVDVVGLPTVREPDGLALSSRNGYLSEADRMIAPQLYQTLLDIKAVVEAGERDYKGIEQAGLRQLEDAGFQPDYVSIRSAADLSVPTPGTGELVVLTAARVGRTRLIDNVRISVG